MISVRVHLPSTVDRKFLYLGEELTSDIDLEVRQQLFNFVKKCLGSETRKPAYTYNLKGEENEKL